jgi:hypothetical protein
MKVHPPEQKTFAFENGDGNVNIHALKSVISTDSGN